MKPIEQENIKQIAQVLLAYLGDPRNNTPNDMLEGIMSGKTLLRAIVAGQLVVCEDLGQVEELSEDS